MARLLGGKLSLHGVDDVEELCAGVLRNWERRTGASLNPADREDALAYLLATAWEVAAFRFNPGKGVPFAAHLHNVLKLRVVDWLRQRQGRSKWKFATHEYVREKPVVLSLDAAARSGDGRGVGDPLGATLQDVSSSDPGDSVAVDRRWPDDAAAGERNRDLVHIRKVARRLDEERARAVLERARERERALTAEQRAERRERYRVAAEARAAEAGAAAEARSNAA